MDSIRVARWMAEKAGREINRSLLEYGALVRKDAERGQSANMSLIEAIRANVDNEKLSDSDFREFVRRSMCAK